MIADHVFRRSPIEWQRRMNPGECAFMNCRLPAGEHARARSLTLRRHRVG